MDPKIDKRTATGQFALEHPGCRCCFITRWWPGHEAEAGEIRARSYVSDDVQRVAQAEDQRHSDVEIFCLRTGHKTIDVDRAGTTGLLDGKRNAARNQFLCERGHVNVATKHKCKVDGLGIEEGV